MDHQMEYTVKIVYAIEKRKEHLLQSVKIGCG